MPTYSPARLAGVAVTAEVIPDNTIPVLDHGFVRLDDAMADDLSVANGARVSFARRKDELDESDEGLIRFLMRERHGTPFEHNLFRFHIKAPLFVTREWQRHRVGSFNERSGRSLCSGSATCAWASHSPRFRGVRRNGSSWRARYRSRYGEPC